MAVIRSFPAVVRVPFDAIENRTGNCYRIMNEQDFLESIKRGILESENYLVALDRLFR